MEAHFHYHIKFIMNVTDIDDKIIKRARLNYLRDQYLSSTPDGAKVNLSIMARPAVIAPDLVMLVDMPKECDQHMQARRSM